MILTFNTSDLSIISTTAIAHPPQAGQKQILLPPGIKYPIVVAEEVADSWAFGELSSPTQPTLPDHWIVGGEVVLSEPLVPCWTKGATTVFSAPTIITYVKREEVLTDMPHITAYYNPITSAVYRVKPSGMITDEIQIFDNSYTPTSAPDTTYTQSMAIDPSAEFVPSCPDYRYSLVPAHTAYSVVEDTARVQRESIISFFATCRDKWQEMKDTIATDNTLLGITAAGKTTEVALAFRDVEYLLSMNSPRSALDSLLDLPIIAPYITEEKKLAWHEEFSRIF